MLREGRTDFFRTMQRLVLAVILLVILIAIGAVLMRGAARVLRPPESGDVALRDGVMPKLSFALLAALTFYVAFAGPS